MPKSVAAGFGPIDEAADGQVVENAVRGRGVQAGGLGDFLQRDRVLVAGQHIEQRKRALQHLDGRRLSFFVLHAQIVRGFGLFCIAKNRFSSRHGFACATAPAVRIVQWLGLAACRHLAGAGGAGSRRSSIACRGADRRRHPQPGCSSRHPARLGGSSASFKRANSAASAPARAASAPSWLRLPKLQGRLTAADLGLLINSNDPYSVAVGDYYARRRGIPEAQILRVQLPCACELESARIREPCKPPCVSAWAHRCKALALAWTQPYAVECNSITSALALGFQPEICKQSCGAEPPVALLQLLRAASPSADLGLRPSMLLAARSVESAQALIERGIAADHSLPSFVPAQAYFVSTPDAARSVRSVLFPPASSIRALGLEARARVQRGLARPPAAAPC